MKEELKKSISAISAFSSAYELIENVDDYTLKKDYSEEEIDFLRGLNDYDPMRFFLVNYDYVIVCEDWSGNVSGEVMTFDEFFSQTMAYVRDQVNS